MITNAAIERTCKELWQVGRGFSDEGDSDDEVQVYHQSLDMRAEERWNFDQIEREITFLIGWCGLKLGYRL